MDRRFDSHRFDFLEEVISVDKAARTVTVSVYPDPRRYEWIDRSGTRYLFDKLDNTYFPENLVFEMLEGATKLPRFGQQDYAFLVSLVLYELSHVVPKFYGHVLKYTGDGLIAYFAEPSFINKNDLAIDCALTMDGLVKYAINPIIEENNYPVIKTRIGLDAGEAFVQNMGSPSTKQHKDIIGTVVSLAAKIQSRANPGAIAFGAAVERNLHVNWRNMSVPLETNENWQYKDNNDKPYKLFQIIPRSYTSEE